MNDHLLQCVKVKALGLLGQNPAYRPSGILLDMITNICNHIDVVIKLCARYLQ